MPLEVKEEAHVPVGQWIDDIRSRVPRPKGPIAVTTSHIPASLDIASLHMIREGLRWNNPVTVILLDNVPPSVDFRAGFHGIHGYNERRELDVHPTSEFWNQKKPYYVLDPELRRISHHHVHEDLRPHGTDIIDFHENLRRELYQRLNLEKVEIVRASELLPKLFRSVLEEYGPKVVGEVVRKLLEERYVTPGGVAKGNVIRLIGGVGSSVTKRAQKKLLSFVTTGDKRALDWLAEKIEKKEVYPKGEFFLMLLLLNRYNHWGNNYFEDSFRANALIKEYGGGIQITRRFEDGYSPVTLYLPGGGKTTAISSVVNVLSHHGIDPVSMLKKLIEAGRRIAFIVPPRL